jgi:CRISPR-associated protein Csb2
VIAIEVELLTGRYVATSFNDWKAPEWPPHPARLFSALVATAHEHEEISDKALGALRWLETQGAPRILASDAEPRTVVNVYVPENATRRVLSGWSNSEEKLEEAKEGLAQAEQTGDPKAQQKAQKAVTAAEKKLVQQFDKASADDGKYNPSACKVSRQMLPDQRGKLPKTLPSVTPEQPRVRYFWPEAAPNVAMYDVLSDLGRRLVRLGHSSSLVACRVLDVNEQDGLASNGAVHEWEPVSDGGRSMRTVAAGQVKSLERAFERHREVEPRVLPAVHQPYRRVGTAPEPEPSRSVFDEWIVLREVAPERGRRVGLRLQRTADVTRALRGALLHHADDPPPETLAGHHPDGARWSGLTSRS